MAAVIVCLGLAISFNSLRCPFVFDDVARVANNPDIRKLEYLTSRLIFRPSEELIFDRNDPSRPVVYATYALNYAVSKLDPFGYHLFNSALHILNAIVVFWIARRLLFGQVENRGSDPDGAQGVGFRSLLSSIDASVAAPLVVALLFLSSPMNMGTVIYVYGRSDVMQGTFGLLALAFFIRWREGSRRALLAVLACFLLALGTKQSAVVLPVVLLAFDVLVPNDGRQAGGPRRMWVHAGLFALSLVYVAARRAYFGAIGDIEGRAGLWDAWSYAAIQPLTILRYVRMLALPYGLSIDHVVSASATTSEKILPLLGLVGIFAGLVALHRGGGPRSRVLVFAGLWFFAWLAPTSSFFPTVDAMVERRVYTASFGFYLAAAAAGAALRAPSWSERSQRFAQVAFVALVVGAFSVVTVYRNALHRRPARLWSEVLRLYPGSTRAMNSLAAALLGEHQQGPALELYQKVIAANPNDYFAFYNIGGIHKSRGDTALASQAFLRAFSINSAYAPAAFELGRLAQIAGDVDSAERYYLRALAVNPDDVVSHNNLGLLYYRQGKRDAAGEQYLKALAIDPTYSLARSNLELLEASTPSGRDVPPRAPPDEGTIVPMDQIPDKVFVDLYENKLREEPDNLRLRRMFADNCLKRRLACAKEQYAILLRRNPSDADLLRIVNSL